MATIISASRPPQPLHNFPDELVQLIADQIDEKDVKSFRAVRLTCRRMYPVATQCFAKARFQTLLISTEKSKVESAIQLFENCNALGLAVEAACLRFPGSHLDALVLEMELKAANTAAGKDALAPKPRESQARRHAERLEADLARLLAQFPNMKSLTLMYMSKLSQQVKLPLPAVQATVHESGCNLTTLIIWDCKRSSSDLCMLLSIFPKVEKLDVVATEITDSWVDALREIRTRGVALQELSLQTGGTCPNRRNFVTTSENLGDTRVQLKEYGVSYDIRLRERLVDAKGAEAVKFVLDRILEGWAEDDEFWR